MVKNVMRSEEVVFSGKYIISCIFCLAQTNISPNPANVCIITELGLIPISPFIYNQNYCAFCA